MYPLANPENLRTAIAHLRKNDAVLATVIDRYGPCELAPHQDYYWALVDSIISQQLSVKAAASIEHRFQELFASEIPSPQQILERSVDELRSAGLSRPKANYIRDLAQHIVDGKLEFNNFATLSDAEIIKELTAVKGIGEWTAHMFLLFCMGRLDVLPTGDLGIRNSIGRLYNLPASASVEQVKDIASANNWPPYQSVASWYIWKSLDNKPAF